VNRKQLVIGGIIIAFMVFITLFISIAVVVWNRWNAPSDVTNPQTSAVDGLPYCSDEEVKPCVVSFGVDEKDNMLANLLVPTTYSRFYLKITYNGTQNVYKCVRVGASLYSAYCVGEKVPPGETFHLMLFAEEDDTLLAEGELSIIGLAFPNIGVVTVTPQDTATLPSMSPAPTEGHAETPDFLLPASTPTPGKFRSSTSTPTLPSYPNPSYPNSSYP
jgi:hypothetical protein